MKEVATMPFTGDTTYNFDGAWNEVPGVYGIMNSSSQMIYIGQTEDLKRRMAEHQADKTHCMHRYSPALARAETITGGEAVRRAREQLLITEYQPPCN